MQQDNNFNERLKLLENQQLPDLSNMDDHWKEMSALLGTAANMPPRKRHWKRITRRTITYMGVAAVVITTTYYALRTGASSNKLKKNIPAAKYQKSETKPQPVIAKQTATSPKSTPVINKKPNHLLVARVRQVSDTVFLKPAASSPGTDIPTLANLYNSLKQPVQQFEIDPERDYNLKINKIYKIKSKNESYKSKKTNGFWN